MKWLTQLFSRRRRYDDLSVSIQEHLEEKIEELMDDGLSREEATRRARREFGNVTLTEERSREAWQWPTLESIWADVRYAFRRLAKAPGFATTFRNGKFYHSPVGVQVAETNAREIPDRPQQLAPRARSSTSSVGGSPSFCGKN